MDTGQGYGVPELWFGQLTPGSQSLPLLNTEQEVAPHPNSHKEKLLMEGPSQSLCKNLSTLGPKRFGWVGGLSAGPEACPSPMGQSKRV